MAEYIQFHMPHPHTYRYTLLYMSLVSHLSSDGVHYLHPITIFNTFDQFESVNKTNVKIFLIN